MRADRVRKAAAKAQLYGHTTWGEEDPKWDDLWTDTNVNTFDDDDEY